MPTMLDQKAHADIVNRIRHLRPEAPRRWGRMTAPQMIAHLIDQMHHTLGDAGWQPRPGVLRNPLVRYLVIYWVPWPKGRVKGPPEAFVTKPTAWEDDVATLIGLTERFVGQDVERDWPDHALFGRMTGKDWGVFCHKHFNHHLTQFGA